MMLIYIILLASIINSQAAPSTLPVGPQELSLTEQFDRTVNQWITELSEQEEFADWRSHTVEWNRQTLGPGLHGWIVLVTDHGQELGYLVVTSDPANAYHLTEYGHGEYPLFSEHTLYHSLVQHELIDSSLSFEQFLVHSYMTHERIYLNPLQSIWIFNTGTESFQLDAKSGDLMTIDEQILEQAMSSKTAEPTWTAPIVDTQKVEKSVQLPASDPYEDLGWILNPPSTIKDLQQLQASLNSGQSLTYVTDLYDDTVVYALSVTGYHQWNAGDTFISIDQEGTRFIPAQYLMETGRYYIPE